VRETGAHPTRSCNAGALGDGGYGTALVRLSERQRSRATKVAVLADVERVPFCQGARLTAWELVKGIGIDTNESICGQHGRVG
jgi:methylthioribose-1-phosphate isomerase